VSKFFEFNGDTIAICTLHHDGTGCAQPDHIFIGDGYYELDEYRYEYTGKSWGGNIPITKLLEWAIEQGYVNPDERNEY